MVRFLSIFPKPGAENLLRAASEKFEKLKKGRIKGALKPGEESPLANAGIN
jgi:general transcription factor 3C polypeptide 5 (transcription factor C subunit 1)